MLPSCELHKESAGWSKATQGLQFRWSQERLPVPLDASAFWVWGLGQGWGEVTGFCCCILLHFSAHKLKSLGIAALPSKLFISTQTCLLLSLLCWGQGLVRADWINPGQKIQAHPSTVTSLSGDEARTSGTVTLCTVPWIQALISLTCL